MFHSNCVLSVNHNDVIETHASLGAEEFNTRLSVHLKDSAWQGNPPIWQEQKLPQLKCEAYSKFHCSVILFCHSCCGAGRLFLGRECVCVCVCAYAREITPDSHPFNPWICILIKHIERSVLAHDSLGLQTVYPKHAGVFPKDQILFQSIKNINQRAKSDVLLDSRSVFDICCYDILGKFQCAFCHIKEIWACDSNLFTLIRIVAGIVIPSRIPIPQSEIGGGGLEIPTSKDPLNPVSIFWCNVGHIFCFIFNQKKSSYLYLSGAWLEIHCAVIKILPQPRSGSFSQIHIWKLATAEWENLSPLSFLKEGLWCAVRACEAWMYCSEYTVHIKPTFTADACRATVPTVHHNKYSTLMDVFLVHPRRYKMPGTVLICKFAGKLFTTPEMCWWPVSVVLFLLLRNTEYWRCLMIAQGPKSAHSHRTPGPFIIKNGILLCMSQKRTLSISKCISAWSHYTLA